MKQPFEYDLYGLEKYKKEHRAYLFGSQFNVYTHDKCIIFSGPKLCSTLIKTANNNIDLLSITTNESNIMDISNTEKTHPLYDEVVKDFKNIEGGRNKKDIIILYREPFRRFISAFAQDYVRGMLQETIDQYVKYGVLNPLIDQWFNNKNINKEDRIKILEWAAYPNRITVERHGEIFTEHHTQVKNQIIRLLVNNSINDANLFSNHHRPYLSSHVRLIDSLGKSKSKVKLVNIDEVDVGKFLYQYDEVYKDCGFVNKNSELSDAVRDEILKLIENESNFKVYTKINWLLYYEYEYYFKIMNEYSDLIYKQTKIEEIDE